MHLEVLELLIITPADICCSFLDQFPTYIVVEWEPVRLVDRLGNIESHPLDVFRHHLVCIGVNAFRISILDTKDVLPAVPLEILIIEKRSPCMAEMERSGWVRCKPHHHSPFSIRKVRERVLLLLLLFREGCMKIRCNLLEFHLLLFMREGSNLCKHLTKNGLDLAGA